MPRGRHKLAPDAVRSSQRERLLQAMLVSIERSGYGATTVPDVIAAARVSKTSFYASFEDKLDCFLALCDEGAKGLYEATATAASSGRTWREAARLGSHAYLRWWQERPALSRAYLVEMPFAGPRAVEQRDRASEPFRRMYRGLARRARREEPGLSPLPSRARELLIAGTLELLAREVRAGRVDRLTELGDDLTAATLALLSGPRRASEAAAD